MHYPKVLRMFDLPNFEMDIKMCTFSSGSKTQTFLYTLDSYSRPYFRNPVPISVPNEDSQGATHQPFAGTDAKRSRGALPMKFQH